MLISESEIVAEVAELELVADGGVTSIKASDSWLRMKTRTIVYSEMNNKEEQTVIRTTDQSDTKSNSTPTTAPAPAAVNKKGKVKGKKSGKRAMIQCKTFIFKPSNNGVINFGYKCMLDEEMVEEAERVFEEEKAKKESDKKADVVVDKKCNSCANNYDEDDQRRRKQPGKSAMNNSKIVVESKVIVPSIIKQQQQQDEEEIKNQQERESQQQVVKRPISVPRRRRSSAPSSLPPIKEETLSELDAAERERWFFEEFCGGVLPPPEELDDWTEPTGPAPIPEFAPCPKSPSRIVEIKSADEKALSAKIEEVQRLGCRKVYDANGNKTIILTPEAKEKFLQMREFREYVMKVRDMKKAMGGRDESEKVMKVEVVPGKGGAEQPGKQASPLVESVSIDAIDVATTTAKPGKSVTPPETPKNETSGYLSSAGVLETPMKSKTGTVSEDKKKEQLKKEKEREREEMRREKDNASEEEQVQPAKRVNTRQQSVDLSSFKRRRI